MDISLLKKYKIQFLSNIIGQKYTVSFLNNSLFKNTFYPLYLFYGMRGTGKTTSARLFALSALCERLPDFQKDPKQNLVPCYRCSSCMAYIENNHPDIIELDAASHTGVETIRSIIDNAYMLPILGKKKIYIIDEVHMLTKAAFNACLKIMEEPPTNVHFILATTELNKVIETIKSRSILLQFKAIPKEILRAYLLNIIFLEKLDMGDDSLDLIIQLSEQSVRDALNIINRLSLIDIHITKEMILSEYGFPEKEETEKILVALLKKDYKSYYEIKKNLSLAYYGQKKFFELAITIIQRFLENFYLYDNTDFQIGTLHSFLRKLYEYENFFLTSQSPFAVLDLFLEEQNLNSISMSENKQVLSKNSDKNNDDTVFQSKKEAKENNIVDNFFGKEIDKNVLLFIKKLDNALYSIFSQSKIEICNEKNSMKILFRKNFSFYKDFLLTKKQALEEAMLDIFNKIYEIEYEFTVEDMVVNDISTRLENKENRLSEIKKIEIVSDAKKSNVIEKNGYNKNYVYEKKTRKKANLNAVSQIFSTIISELPGITYIKE